MSTIEHRELAALCRDALRHAGAAPAAAEVVAEATVEAERVGNRAVGVAHLRDYIDGYRRGRIAPNASPEVYRPAAALVDVDACDGTAQLAFAIAAEDLGAAARTAGIAALSIRNSFTCGELGWYARRLAEQGFVAVAAANSPALMSVGGAGEPVLGTNPLAYGIPRPGALPIVVDQASSSTAFVNVRRAADAGEEIPPGWALGPDGQGTRDASAALEGALLPFGGYRGGNIALLVETLATLSGASFSTDAAPFDTGTRPPRIGVFVLAVDVAAFPGALERTTEHLHRLRADHGVHIPALELTDLPDNVDVHPQVLQTLHETAGREPTRQR